FAHAYCSFRLFGRWWRLDAEAAVERVADREERHDLTVRKLLAVRLLDLLLGQLLLRLLLVGHGGPPVRPSPLRKPHCCGCSRSSSVSARRRWRPRRRSRHL